MSLDEDLWNQGAKEDFYEGNTPLYQAAIMEQYKIYVEMADRISQRRGNTNTFFLTLNTGIVTAIGFVWEHKLARSAFWLSIPFGMLLVECFVWFYLLRSYRLLNAAKYEVVGSLEKRLPASPYWSAEWTALGKGKDSKKYWPLSHIEGWVPIFFASLYIISAMALAIK